jgi:hypothetical protein
VTTQADVNTGYFTNNVTASGLDSFGDVATAQQKVTLAASTVSVQLLASSSTGKVGTPLTGTVAWANSSSASLQLIYAVIGPMAPINGSCQGVNWNNAATIFTATPVLGIIGLNYQTMAAQSFTPTSSGCYSYSGYVFDAAGAFVIAPGGSGETTLVQ